MFVCEYKVDLENMHLLPWQCMKQHFNSRQIMNPDQILSIINQPKYVQKSLYLCSIKVFFYIKCEGGRWRASFQVKKKREEREPLRILYIYKKRVKKTTNLVWIKCMCVCALDILKFLNLESPFTVI